MLDAAVVLLCDIALQSDLKLLVFEMKRLVLDLGGGGNLSRYFSLCVTFFVLRRQLITLFVRYRTPGPVFGVGYKRKDEHIQPEKNAGRRCTSSTAFHIFLGRGDCI